MHDVEGCAKLVAIEVVEHPAHVGARPWNHGREVAAVVQGLVELQANHFGPEIRQDAGAGWARDDVGKVYYPDAFQRVLSFHRHSVSVSLEGQADEGRCPRGGLSAVNSWDQPATRESYRILIAPGVAVNTTAEGLYLG